MRSGDLIGMAIGALWRQKLRTILTLIGVMVGTAILVSSVALGLGVRDAVELQFQKENRLREIVVWPGNKDTKADNFDDVPAAVREIQGEMSEAKRERLRRIAVERWRSARRSLAQVPLTIDRIAQLRQIPHVVAVIPRLDDSARITFMGRVGHAGVSGSPFDSQHWDHFMDAGTHFSSDGAQEVIINEYLLYQLGIHDDSQVRDAIGKPVKLELRQGVRTGSSLLPLFGANPATMTQDESRVLEKVFRQLPESLLKMELTQGERVMLQKLMKEHGPGTPEEKPAIIEREFKLVGVLRTPDHKEDNLEEMFESYNTGSEIHLPTRTAEDYFLQLPRRAEHGFGQARIVVDGQDNLQNVVHEVKSTGLQVFSLGVIVQQIRHNVMLIGFALDFVALVALVVAALGIANTMFTSVLERTREIGILKAVGARDRQVLLIFLAEGALIGLLGGAMGVLIGWLLSFPGDHKALAIMREQGTQPLPETVFRYPLWLIFGVPAFAVAMTTLAAFLPARRGSRIEPVIALRHD